MNVRDNIDGPFTFAAAWRRFGAWAGRQAERYMRAAYERDRTRPGLLGKYTPTGILEKYSAVLLDPPPVQAVVEVDVIDAMLPKLPPEQLSLVLALRRREADAQRWPDALAFLRKLPHRWNGWEPMAPDPSTPPRNNRDLIGMYLDATRPGFEELVERAIAAPSSYLGIDRTAAGSKQWTEKRDAPTQANIEACIISAMERIGRDSNTPRTVVRHPGWSPRIHRIADEVDGRSARFARTVVCRCGCPERVWCWPGQTVELEHPENRAIFTAVIVNGKRRAFVFGTDGVIDPSDDEEPAA